MFFLCFFVWLIFSMRLSIEVVAAGVIISLIVYRFARRHMRHRPTTIAKMLRNLLLGLQYACILVTETAKANIEVFRIVFARVIEQEPQLLFFRTNLKSNITRVVLANSITLTPGTISVALNDDLFCVYCLNRKIAGGVKDSVFIRHLEKFETDT